MAESRSLNTSGQAARTSPTPPPPESNEGDSRRSSSLSPLSRTPTPPPPPPPPLQDDQPGSGPNASGSGAGRDSRPNMLRFMSRVRSLDDPERPAIDDVIWTAPRIQRRLLEGTRRLATHWGTSLGFMTDYIDLVPVRDVSWRTSQTNRRISTHASQVISVVAQSSGYVAATGCVRCQEHRGPFDSCVLLNLSVDGAAVAGLNGACANCFYHGHPDSCSFHPRYTGPLRATLRVPEPVTAAEMANNMIELFYSDEEGVLDDAARAKLAETLANDLTAARESRRRPGSPSRASPRKRKAPSTPKRQRRKTEHRPIDSFANRPRGPDGGGSGGTGAAQQAA
ncbi:MAG: hypothetical protein Q9190_007160 [Brigantiaea leucoxantha]